MPQQSPIGIFDSGVGGLSIAREIRNLLPNEDMLYYADSAYCPYGEKPPADIKKRVFSLCDFLLSQGAKLLVVACNTASIVSLDDIRQRYQVPVVGVEPAVKPAVAATKSGTIGVLATGVTLSGDRFSSLVARYCHKTAVITQPAPGLVELVEKGKIQGNEAEQLLVKYLNPLLEQNADTIVLGCTHYPFLRPLIENIVGPNITIIDTGKAVARQTARLLKQMKLSCHDTTKPGKELFYTSASQETVEQVVRLLWNDRSVKVKHMPLT
ncbi:glutamate racemase [Desulfofalx alkaliphila]|uniref:glutamate racemase n=1 Tax=Desulfofalx alkaliphila TaxID=105483 RepID=UPI0004E13BBA|nr:glutamate racemase [Desulfofalx alkaliphila]